MPLVQEMAKLMSNGVTPPARAAGRIDQDRAVALLPVGQKTALERGEVLFADLLDVKRRYSRKQARRM